MTYNRWTALSYPARSSWICSIWYAATDYLDIFEALRSDYGHVRVQTYFFDGYARGIFDKNSLYQANMDALNPDIAAKLFPGWKH